MELFTAQQSLQADFDPELAKLQTTQPVLQGMRQLAANLRNPGSWIQSPDGSGEIVNMKDMGNVFNKGELEKEFRPFLNASTRNNMPTNILSLFNSKFGATYKKRAFDYEMDNHIIPRNITGVDREVELMKIGYKLYNWDLQNFVSLAQRRSYPPTEKHLKGVYHFSDTSEPGVSDLAQVDDKA